MLVVCVFEHFLKVFEHQRSWWYKAMPIHRTIGSCFVICFLGGENAAKPTTYLQQGSPTYFFIPPHTKCWTPQSRPSINTWQRSKPLDVTGRVIMTLTQRRKIQPFSRDAHSLACDPEKEDHYNTGRRDAGKGYIHGRKLKNHQSLARGVKPWISHEEHIKVSH